MKEERKIIDENDVTHPELAPVFHESLKTLKLLIKKKYNVNEKNCEGELVLFDALDCNPVFVRILIEAGANFNAEDRNFDFFEEGNRNIFMPYRSSLREADIIENCAKNLVKLLNHKFTSTNSNYQIIPPFLSFSAKDKNTTMIKFLIVYGFHPLKQDKNGNTAFHLALKQDQIEIEIIKILLKNHYPIIPNNEGELPIDIARKKNLTEIIELFEAKSDFFREFSPTNLSTKPQEILPSKPKNKIVSPNKSI